MFCLRSVGIRSPVELLCAAVDLDVACEVRLVPNSSALTAAVCQRRGSDDVGLEGFDWEVGPHNGASRAGW